MFGPSNAFSPFCNADTAGPVDPRASRGVFGSAGSTCHVSGPTTPSGVRLFPCWNDLTASRVFGPNWLSMSETSNTFVITKIICSRRTSGPAEPIDKIGPLFTTSSSTTQNAPTRTECGLFLPGHSQDAIRNYVKSPGTAYRCCPHPSNARALCIAIWCAASLAVKLPLCL